MCNRLNFLLLDSSTFDRSCSLHHFGQDPDRSGPGVSNNSAIWEVALDRDRRRLLICADSCLRGYSDHK